MVVVDGLNMLWAVGGRIDDDGNNDYGGVGGGDGDFSRGNCLKCEGL